MENELTIFEQVKKYLSEECLENAADIEQVLEPLDEIGFIAKALLSEDDLVKAYANATGLTVLEREDLENVESFDDKFSLEYMQNYNFIPLSWDKDKVTIVVGSAYFIDRISYDLSSLFGLECEFRLTRASLVERIQNRLYAVEEVSDEFDWNSDGSEEALQNLAKEAPVVRFVNDTFSRALDSDASDIHIEPLESNFVVRYRVDGVLQLVAEMPLNMFPAVTSRIKLIGGMNIAEHRLPQDGRTELKIGHHQVDLRISSVPSTNGESVVIRILKKNVKDFSLRSIGMGAQLESQFVKAISLPHGLVLVVGPTGSGKSTTLYCSMNILNTGASKILTVEDPVEYQIHGITQVHVKQSIGLTFASALRSFLRQDPDIILVGEIRDRETAEIAINAALTGHLVLSTLHTNDACGAISRLQDMGVENFLISTALVGVLSQRLIRQICPECRSSGVDSEGKKCRNCGGTGYRGRIGIFEFLDVNDKIRKAINANKDSATLAEIAKQNGMKFLSEDGADKVRSGVSSQAEISRVCQLDGLS